MLAIGRDTPAEKTRRFAPHLSNNLDQSTQINTCRKLSITMTIHLPWWGMRDLLKAHEPFKQPGRSAAHQVVTIAFEMACSIGVIESATRFNCATKIAAQIRTVFNLIAVRSQSRQCASCCQVSRLVCNENNTSHQNLGAQGAPAPVLGC